MKELLIEFLVLLGALYASLIIILGALAMVGLPSDPPFDLAALACGVVMGWGAARAAGLGRQWRGGR